MSQTMKMKLFATTATTMLVMFGVALAILTAHGQENNTFPKDDIREPAAQLRSDELLIPQVLERLESFQFISMAIRDTKLDELLSQEGPFTVFVPFDEAFVKLPFSTIQEFQDDREEIKDVLSYHIASKRLVSSELSETENVTSLQGEELSISNDLGGLKVNDATFIFKDIETANGIIHVIDTVLFPSGGAYESRE